MCSVWSISVYFISFALSYGEDVVVFVCFVLLSLLFVSFLSILVSFLFVRFFSSLVLSLLLLCFRFVSFLLLPALLSSVFSSFLF